jgi:hypothetical protein
LKTNQKEQENKREQKTRHKGRNQGCYVIIVVRYDEEACCAVFIVA